MRRWVALFLVASFLVAGGLAGCSVGGAAGATTITLYNGQHQQTTRALVRAFEAQTGIRVRERDGDEDQLAAQVEQEGSASPADVIYTENSPALMALQEKGRLSALPAAILSQVPSRFDSPAGQWVGVSARVSVLVYNTSRVSAQDLPTSVLDLADPRWRAKLALAPTETDFQPVVTSIAEARGAPAAVAWLKAVRSNASSHVDPDNETVTADVNGGQAAIGLIDHYYWYRLAKEVGSSGVHSKIAYFASGDPGYVLDVSGAAVLRSSRHQAAADEFLQFLVSSAGQSVMVGSDSFEYPLVPGAEAPAGLVPFLQLRPAPVGISQLGDGSVAVALLRRAQLI